MNCAVRKPKNDLFAHSTGSRPCQSSRLTRPSPRPEEEIADVLRTKPDVEDQSEHRVKWPHCQARNDSHETVFIQMTLEPASAHP